MAAAAQRGFRDAIDRAPGAAYQLDVAGDQQGPIGRWLNLQLAVADLQRRRFDRGWLARGRKASADVAAIAERLVLRCATATKRRA